MKRLILTLVVAAAAIMGADAAEKTKTYDFGDIKGIHAGHSYKVYVTKGNSGKVKVIYDDRIEIFAGRLQWYKNSIKGSVDVCRDGLLFEYKGYAYRADVEGADIIERKTTIDLIPDGGKIVIYPARIMDKE